MSDCPQRDHSGLGRYLFADKAGNFRFCESAHPFGKRRTKFIPRGRGIKKFPLHAIFRCAEKPLLKLSAHGVVNGKMQLLDARCGLGRRHDGYVRQLP